MSESARRTKSEHNKKRIRLTTTTAVAAAAIMMMMLYAVPTQQQQFAAATVTGPGPITDGDIGQEIEDTITRLSNLQQEVEDERARVILAGLINVLEDALERLRPPTPPTPPLPPPPPPPGAPVYCYDYRGETGGVESVCFTNMEACENSRVADPREVISTECYEQQQPEN